MLLCATPGIHSTHDYRYSPLPLTTSEQLHNVYLLTFSYTTIKNNSGINTTEIMGTEDIDFMLQSETTKQALARGALEN